MGLFEKTILSLDKKKLKLFSCEPEPGFNNTDKDRKLDGRSFHE